MLNKILCALDRHKIEITSYKDKEKRTQGIKVHCPICEKVFSMSIDQLKERHDD